MTSARRLPVGTPESSGIPEYLCRITPKSFREARTLPDPGENTPGWPDGSRRGLDRAAGGRRREPECVERIRLSAPVAGDSGGAVFQLDSTLTKAVAVGSISGVLSQPSEGGTTQCWTLFQTVGTTSND